MLKFVILGCLAVVGLRVAGQGQSHTASSGWLCQIGSRNTHTYMYRYSVQRIRRDRSINPCNVYYFTSSCLVPLLEKIFDFSSNVYTFIEKEGLLD